MSTPFRLGAMFVLLGLAVLSGCQCMSHSHDHDQIPPVPWRECQHDENFDQGGAMLKTGGFQLGSDVGRDFQRTMGDNEWGF